MFLFIDAVTVALTIDFLQQKTVLIPNKFLALLIFEDLENGKSMLIGVQTEALVL